MSPEQRRLARHALGLDGERVVSYRNRYCAGIDTSQHIEWHQMHQRGWADEPRYGAAIVNYALTRDGAELALDPGERLDLEDFPPALSAADHVKGKT